MTVLKPRHSPILPLVLGIAIAAARLPTASPSLAESESQDRVRLVLPAKGRATEARRIDAAGQAVVNLGEMARREALLGPRKGEIRAKVMEELEEPEEPFSPFAPATIQPSAMRPGSIQAPQAIQVASPSPTSSFIGLDDIPMVDSLYIIIPPDCGGAVGPTKVMSGLNNNYRVFNKNWSSISINRYGNVGLLRRGISLVVDYGQARVGTGTGTLFTLASNTHFCSAPVATYSATEDTLFVVTHLSSTGATYSVDL